MNTRLLRKVAKHIAEEPKRFAMSSYVQTNTYLSAVNDFGRKYDFPACGTAACIGGWAVILSGGNVAGIVRPQAERALSLTPEQGSRLFNLYCWPRQFERRYRKATRPETKALIGNARIEHFIKTKGKE